MLYPAELPPPERKTSAVKGEIGQHGNSVGNLASAWLPVFTTVAEIKFEKGKTTLDSHSADSTFRLLSRLTGW